MNDEIENILINNNVDNTNQSIYNIAYLLGELQFIVFIINIIICLSTMKNIKKNKTLLIVSIVTAIFSYGFKISREIIGMTDELYKNNKSIYLIITFIIQIIIFILLIINIKNKKKEENPKCQE